MRIANVANRLNLLTPKGGVDVERASDGRFPADPQAIYAQWSAFVQWAKAAPTASAQVVHEKDFGAPAPRPTQVFGIGLNYRAHAAESGMPLPERPATFTKFPTCIVGPQADVQIPSAAADWEVELVVVIGQRAHRVAEKDAWSYVAGLTIGQDISERVVQWSGGGQFSLGKSFPTFGPTGPCLITPDEVKNPNDLELSCSVNGEEMQRSRTSDMVFSVSQLVFELSSILPLLPGDVIFTGTPAGVGGTRQPPRFLRPGDELVSEIEGIGTLRNRCVAAA